MNDNELNKIADAVAVLALEASVSTGDIVDALVGIAWDEEEAGEILHHLARPCPPTSD